VKAATGESHSIMQNPEAKPAMDKCGLKASAESLPQTDIDVNAKFS
jgi:hypothetical protein